jgi:hypothetical protein
VKHVINYQIPRPDIIEDDLRRAAAKLQEIENEISCCDDVPLQNGAVYAIANLRQQRDDMAKHLAAQMQANIKMLAAMKRGVFILDALGKNRQTHDLLWLRSKMNELIKKYDPEHNGNE